MRRAAFLATWSLGAAIVWSSGCSSRTAGHTGAGGADSALPDDGAIPDSDSRGAGGAPNTGGSPSTDAGDAGDAVDASDAATVIDDTHCPWRTAAGPGSVNQAAVTLATPFAPPDDSLTFTPPRIPCALFPITDYGAASGGTTKNTTAFARAISAATAAGGGVVVVPAGIWLTGPIHLASTIELHLEAGATLRFSQDFSDYLPPVPTRWEGLDVMNWSPLIYARDCHDVALTGAGTLDGQGSVWASWKTAGKAEDQRIYDYYVARLPLDPANLPAAPVSAVNPGLRPAFVEFDRCTNVLLDGNTITGSPYWTVHPLYSDGVIVRNVAIDTRSTDSNGDGVDPDSSTNVLVERVDFATSDDCIAIKSGLNEDGIAVGKPSRNVVVRNVTASTGHGGVAIGSEMSGGIQNVFVTSSGLHGLAQPIRVKTLPGRGGTIEDLWFSSDLSIDWNTTAMELTAQYAASTIPPHDPSLIPTIRRIRVQGVTGSGTGPVYSITGPMTEISLEGVNLSGAAGTCASAPGTALTSCSLTGVAAGASVLPCN